MESQKVWFPDDSEGYILGRIVDIGQDTVTVQPYNQPNRSIVASYNATFPAEKEDNKAVDDNCALMYLNEATLLNNVRLKYKQDQIYVSI